MSGSKSIAKRRLPGVRLAWFFAGSFALAWIPWLTVILVKGTSTRVAVVGLYAPALSALAVAGLTGGRREIVKILARLTHVRFNPRWWLLAILLMPAVYGVAVVVSDYRHIRLLLGSNSWWFLPLSYLYLMIATAGEEIGWRGYALPLLLETRIPPLAGAIGLGVIWGVWHIPMRLSSGLAAFTLPLFILFTTALSIIYLVLYRRSNGSLISAIMLHASTDFAPRVFDISEVQWQFWLTADVVLMIAATALWISGPRRLLTGP